MFPAGYLVVALEPLVRVILMLLQTCFELIFDRIGRIALRPQGTDEQKTRKQQSADHNPPFPRAGEYPG